MRRAAWTEEQIALLRRLWASGETADVIGSRLGGVSRSAVLGKIFRLRLNAKAAAPKPAAQNHAATANHGPAAARSCPHRSEAGAEAAAGKTAPARRRRSARQDTAKPAVAVRQHRTLLELTNDSCRWPHGRPGTAGFFFCGAPGVDLERG